MSSHPYPVGTRVYVPAVRTNGDPMRLRGVVVAVLHWWQATDPTTRAATGDQWRRVELAPGVVWDAHVDTLTAARYLCKRCGAESPAGIGYAVTVPGPLPAPDPACPHPHA